MYSAHVNHPLRLELSQQIKKTINLWACRCNSHPTSCQTMNKIAIILRNCRLVTKLFTMFKVRYRTSPSILSNWPRTGFHASAWLLQYFGGRHFCKFTNRGRIIHHYIEPAKVRAQSTSQKHQRLSFLHLPGWKSGL